MIGQKSDLLIVRVFEAPVERVWNAWTRAEEITRWWGPRDFTSPSAKIDFRVGGKYLLSMRSEMGPEIWKKGIWSTGVFKQIVPMKKIVYTDSFADASGDIVPSSYYGLEGFPQSLEVVLTFEEIRPAKTKMMLVHKGLPEEAREDCRKGWNESFDKLDEYLSDVKK